MLFSGDLVEYDAGVYTGDATSRTGRRRWTRCARCSAEALVPGRGEAMNGAATRSTRHSTTPALGGDAVRLRQGGVAAKAWT